MISALRTHAIAFLSIGFLTILTACGSGLTSGSSGNGNGNGGGNGNGSGAAAQHVVVVVFENEDYSTVVGNSSMPYWNQLASQYSLATQFYANVHPSMGNYFLMTAGQDPSAGLSDPDSFSGTLSGDNIASVLTSAGKTWKVYAQSIPLPGYTGGDQYPYVKHHNPFAYFQSVLGSPGQTVNISALSQLSTDASGGSLPSYSFIVPDDEHNGHDCPTGGSSCPLSDRLAAVDSFLNTNIQPLLENSSLANNTIVIVTFDESADDNTNGGGRIPVIIAGGPIKTSYQSTTTYQFPSLLRFSLESLGVSSYPGAASSAPSMNEFLK